MMHNFESIRGSTISFLNSLYKGSGFYSFTRGNDLYDGSIRWGLGNTVYAVKTLAILDSLKDLDGGQKKEIVDFIKGFQQENGFFGDPLLRKKMFVREKLSAVKNNDYINFWGNATLRAETRQAVVALMLLDEAPDRPFTGLRRDRVSINRFIDGLNWDDIWGSASQLGHIMFFAKTNIDHFGQESGPDAEVIENCLRYIDDINKKEDGLWYRGEVSPRQKINGAMKIISAFNIIGEKRIRYPEKIMDFILDCGDDYYVNGCDVFNALYVIRNCLEICDPEYRTPDVERFCETGLDFCKEHFLENTGGFSMKKGRNPRFYYGMKVANGFSGADIHATMLFIWAVSLIARITGVGVSGFSEIIN